MPRVFISPSGRHLSSTLGDVCIRLRNKYIYSDHSTHIVLEESVLQYILELDVLLRNTNVRGHLNTRMCLPVVDQNSSFGKLLKRLKNQINAVCVLSDTVHIAPPANPDEDDVISRVHEVLNLLLDSITPPSSSSSSDSDCETYTD